MNKVRNLIAAFTIVSLLAVGLVAVASNGFGESTDWAPQQAASGDCDLSTHDADGDGIINSEDTDWVRRFDGSGYGKSEGLGQGNFDSRPLDGSGYGAGQGGGLGQGAGNGMHAGVGK